MSTYEVGYQIHESQVTRDEWITMQMGEVEVHEWFDRYREQVGVLAVRVVRVDRTIIRHAERPDAQAER